MLEVLPALFRVYSERVVPSEPVRPSKGPFQNRKGIEGASIGLGFLKSKASEGPLVTFNRTRLRSANSSVLLGASSLGH